MCRARRRENRHGCTLYFVTIVIVDTLVFERCWLRYTCNETLDRSCHRIYVHRQLVLYQRAGVLTCSLSIRRRHYRVGPWSWLRVLSIKSTIRRRSHAHVGRSSSVTRVCLTSFGAGDVRRRSRIRSTIRIVDTLLFACSSFCRRIRKLWCL